MKKMYCVLAGFLVLMLIAFGCGEDNVSMKASAEKSVDVKGDFDQFQGQMSFFRFGIADALMTAEEGPKFESGSCPAVTWDIDWRAMEGSVILDYGDGCQTRFGKYVSGLIEVNVAVTDDGLTVPIAVLFDEYSVGGKVASGVVFLEAGSTGVFFGMTGEVDIYEQTMGGDNLDSTLSFTNCVLEATFGGGEYEVIFSGAISFLKYEVSDNPSGQEYALFIDSEDPVTFDDTCAYPLSGKITAQFVIVVPLEAFIDFGYPNPGVCDSEFDYGIQVVK